VIFIDPAAMTPRERLDELAELLARGLQRYFADEGKAPASTKNSQVRLAAPGEAEAPCGPHALSPESMEPAR